MTPYRLTAMDRLWRVVPLIISGGGGVFIAHDMTLIGWLLTVAAVFTQNQIVDMEAERD